MYAFFSRLIYRNNTVYHITGNHLPCIFIENVILQDSLSFCFSFQLKLPEIYKDVHETYSSIDGRLKAEQFKVTYFTIHFKLCSCMQNISHLVLQISLLKY